MLPAENLRRAADHLYETFSCYSDPGTDFCGFCYTPDQIRRIQTTELRALCEDDCRTLLWECFDHWESSEIYKHYLPRILESMAPPLRVEDMYPDHLFDTMLALGFHDWPARERAAVVDYLKALQPVLTSMDEMDVQEWEAAFEKLAHPNGT